MPSQITIKTLFYYKYFHLYKLCNYEVKMTKSSRSFIEKLVLLWQHFCACASYRSPSCAACSDCIYNKCIAFQYISLVCFDIKPNCSVLAWVFWSTFFLVASGSIISKSASVSASGKFRCFPHGFEKWKTKYFPFLQIQIWGSAFTGASLYSSFICCLWTVNRFLVSSPVSPR